MKIETRIPKAGQWVKTVTAVKETAKTGYDWSGEFLQSDRLADAEIGSLVITCGTGGSRKHPYKVARLYALTSDGEWTELAKAESDEWAYELREAARGWLAKTPEQINREVYTIRKAKLEADRARRIELGAEDTFGKAEITRIDAELAAVIAQLAQSEAKPESEPGIDLSKISTADLFAEIARRETRTEK